MELLIKAIIGGIVIATVSTVSQRYPTIGAFVLGIPLATIVAFIFMHMLELMWTPLKQSAYTQFGSWQCHCCSFPCLWVWYRTMASGCRYCVLVLLLVCWCLCCTDSSPSNCKYPTNFFLSSIFWCCIPIQSYPQPNLSHRLNRTNLCYQNAILWSLLPVCRICWVIFGNVQLWARSMSCLFWYSCLRMGAMNRLCMPTNP